MLHTLQRINGGLGDCRSILLPEMLRVMAGQGRRRTEEAVYTFATAKAAQAAEAGKRRHLENYHDFQLYLDRCHMDSECIARAGNEHWNPKSVTKWGGR